MASPPASPVQAPLTAAENPLPQLAPGAGGHGGIDNPVLLDVAMGTSSDKAILIMVGLPARGKTFIARKIQRYLGFFHAVTCKVFNVGNYRRTSLGNFQAVPRLEDRTTFQKDDLAACPSSSPSSGDTH